MKHFQEGDLARVANRDDDHFGQVGEVIEVAVEWEKTWISLRINGEEAVYAPSELRRIESVEAMC